tara:strand:+ start:65 stop:970 length:906 start_codon:yes stop_codon:yes gene_type:complete
MRRRVWTSIVTIFLLLSLFSTSSLNAETSPEAQERHIEILKIIPHDTSSFTQGLEISKGSLFESSGLYGHSKLIEIDITNGETLRQFRIGDSFFAEGVTIVGESAILLTWREEVAFEINISEFSITQNFTFEGEGWGICYDDEFLVMSNGSSELAFRDPETFEINHSIVVFWDGEVVSNLNELECVGGTIYANIWKKDEIIAINSSTGIVEFFASASNISKHQGTDDNEVLNGIAFDDDSGGFWITGKNWTEMYLVNFLVVESSKDDSKSPLSNPILLVVGAILIGGISKQLLFSRKDRSH